MRGACAAVLLLAAGCAETGNGAGAPQPFAPEYLGVETRKMDGELVNFVVAMRGARSERDVSDYARCAAAQYSLIRGYAFARHLRTTVSQGNGVRGGGVWRADAVYTISPALPDGLRTIDAEVTVAHCRDSAIPTV